MVVMSKPLKYLTLGTLAFTTWAVWYDNYRRSKPDYKQKLVEKRKEQLRQKRIKEDPLYYVRTLPIYEGDFNNMQGVQMYMMEKMQEGEQMLMADEDGMKKGCAIISIAMSYIPMQQRQMAFGQLAQTLPREILVLMQKMMPIASGRVQTQRLQAMFKNQSNVARGDNDSSALPTNDLIREANNASENNKDDGPDDVDSIDGDSEERIVEIDDLDEVKAEALPEDVSEKKTEETGSTTPERIEEAINDQPEQVIAKEKSSQNLSNLDNDLIPAPIEEEQSSIMPEETPLVEESIDENPEVDNEKMEQSEHEVLKLEPEDIDLEQEEEEEEKETLVEEADTNELIEDEIIEESAQIEENNTVQESREEFEPAEEAVEAETKILDESQQQVVESSSSSSSSSSESDNEDEDLD